MHAKHISSADYEEVINSATPENMHVEPAIPAPEILEQKPLPAVHSRSKVSASAIKAKASLRPVAPPIPSVHKHLESPSKTVLKKTRFEYADERTMKPLDAPPGMEDLANALQDIQQVSNATLNASPHMRHGIHEMHIRPCFTRSLTK